MAEKKPLVNADWVTDFGAIEETEEFNQEGPGRLDYTHVPGWSELRYEQDVAKGKLERREIRPNEVQPLPGNVRWFRTVKGKDSDPDQMRVAHAKVSGYRPVTKDDIGQHPWLTALPPAGMIAPDGTIKSASGDLALYYIGPQGAARNALRKKIATELSVDGMQFQSGGVGKVSGELEQVGRQHKGSDPTVNVTIGTQAKGVTK